VLWSGDDLLVGHERIPGDTVEQGQKGKPQKGYRKYSSGVVDEKTGA